MIDIQSLTKTFKIGKQTITAVNNVSLCIEKGKTLGLVGESGSGKSTLGKLLMRLEKPTSGQIYFEGEPLIRNRTRDMQMIFQDPFASLNPRMTVGDLIAEPLYIHGVQGNIDELLDLVNLPKTAKHRFPHEFSGGQRQRIGIARALALRPKFIVCDEPISALDVSIQAQIVALLKRLQKELKLTYLFISHDLPRVQELSDTIAVMYMGHIVEMGPADKIFTHPRHPYTQLLIASAPIPDPLYKRPPLPILGEPPSLLNLPEGCPFSPRCPKKEAICKKMPQLIGGTACHLSE